MSIERLSIVEDEGDENIFHMEEAEEGQANLDLCYVGYFLMDHLIRKDGDYLEARMRYINKESGDRSVLFHFSMKSTYRVFTDGPWTFDNHTLVLAGFMLESIGKHLENYLGDILEYDSKNNMSFRKTYMRI
ncbi:hypothetical protein GmHk_19G054785 [Glycine max]|nr:hypothetical protein GmHk_19G054785 [Glycine max]